MEDLRNGLEDFGCKLKNETILTKLNEIRMQHGLSVDDTVDEWVAFMENQQSPEITEDVVYKFESKLCSTLEKSSNLVTPQRKDSNKFAVFSRQTLDSRKFEEDLLGAYVNFEDGETMASCKSPTVPGVVKSPDCGSEETTMSIPCPVTTPSQKKSDSSIVSSLGGKWEQHTSLPKCTVGLLSSTDVDDLSSFGYMYQMDHSKSTDLNRRLVELSDKILLWHNLEPGVGLDIPSQDTCVYVGRVLSEAADGRLNVMSCLLEGTRETSQGCVVKLDLSSVTNASVFPGQVLVVEGTNVIGGHLKASKVYHECTPDVHRSRQQSTEFLMIMASGPFTTLDSLEYSPLKELLEVVKQDRPSILILCGPFIDSRHPLVENWMSPDELPDNLFIDILLQVLLVAKEFSCQVVVLPSQYDLHHHPVYPQPPFSKVLVQKRLLEKGLTVGDCSCLHFFQDPSVIDVNGVSVGVTSTDTLKHLAGQTCDISCQRDRMATLINHLYTQKSFYPLYPPHDSVNMDVDQCYEHAALETRPDVLILPSEMKHFIKVLHGGVCINPGVLTKGKVKGTFARLYFSGAVGDKSSDRFQVQVLRL